MPKVMLWEQAPARDCFAPPARPPTNQLQRPELCSGRFLHETA
jgi:hypothetical protein